MGASADRGAVLIVVAFGLLTLLAFSSVVVDQGMLWVARGQAQNAADAAAHAGAVALAFNSLSNRTDSGPAKQAALSTALTASIWGELPAVTGADVTFPTVPADPDCGAGAAPPCVRVDVFRDTAHGNPLPTYFAGLVGVTAQATRATATAKAAAGNASACVKPWILVDRWQENRAPAASFNRYTGRGGLLPPPRDAYLPPTASSTGTGYSLSDVGTFLTLTRGDPGDPISPFTFFPVSLPINGGTSGGGAGYQAVITGCNGVPVTIGTVLTTVTTSVAAATYQAVTALIAQDPAATWNTAAGRVDDSCARHNPPCAPMSPRLVPLALFSPDTYTSPRSGGASAIAVINLLGFFVTSVNSGGNIGGYITTVRGKQIAGLAVGQQSAFTRDVILVR